LNAYSSGTLRLNAIVAGAAKAAIVRKFVIFETLRVPSSRDGLPIRGRAGNAGFGFAAAVLSVALLPQLASAQVQCTVSGTAPGLGCGPTAAATQAVIQGSQSLATQSNSVVMDRLMELRKQQQQQQPQVTSVPLSYTKAPRKADPITPHLAPRTATTARPAVWVRAFGDFEHRDGSTSFAVLPANTLITFDNVYRQQSGGAMAGADVVIGGLTSPNDGLIFGAFGGGLASRITVTGGRHELSGGTVGVYGTYFNGGFFLDATAKGDFLGFDTNVIGLPATADVRNFSFLSNIGYKFDLANRWYVEPTAGIEYVSTEFSNQNILPTTIAFLEDSHLFRGRVGVRVGTEFMSGNIRIEPSLLALAYYYFDATGATIALGATGGTIVLPTDEGKFRGELQAAVNFFDLGSGVSWFVRGDLRFGEDLIGGGGRVGWRYQF
jgi:outer membrane autotransporter protein